MMLFKAPALFFTLIAACVAAPTSPPTSADPEVARRWYSIPEDQEVFQEHTRPWPVGKDGLRTINYCFEDVYSYHQISNILELGLAKWEPATRVSALRFAPDPACEQEPCLCDVVALLVGAWVFLLGGRGLGGVLLLEVIEVDGASVEECRKRLESLRRFFWEAYDVLFWLLSSRLKRPF